MSESMIDLVTSGIVIGMLMLVMLAMVAWLTRPTSLATHEPCEEALPIVVVEPITTPDEARERMLTKRELVAKAVRDAIEDFCNEGNDEVAMVFSDVDDLLIAELLEYQRAGWHVVFGPDTVASISLPAVLS